MQRDKRSIRSRSERTTIGLDRRAFLRTVSAAALGATTLGTVSRSSAAPAERSAADAAVKALYEALSEPQRKAMCFDWDKKGYSSPPLPLRLHVTNNWGVSNTTIAALTRD